MRAVGPAACRLRPPLNKWRRRKCRYAHVGCVTSVAVVLTATPIIARGQDAARPRLFAAEAESETEEIVVSATRLPILEEQSPATVTVVTAQELEERQIRRVADALREVPGLAVVQTGPPGTIDLRFYPRPAQRAHAGSARWNSDQPGTGRARSILPISRSIISTASKSCADRKARSMGRARWRASSKFSRSAGAARRRGTFSVEGGSFGTFRETAASQGSWKQFDYSVGAEPAGYR